MQLTYRGTHYDYTARGAEAVRETTVFRTIRPAFNLHYRGSVYTVNPDAELNLPATQPKAQLHYRGAAYALNGWTQPAAVQDTFSIASSKPRFSKTADDEGFTAVHRTNLHTNLQRRLQVARERGDENLINLLERELQQIA